MNNSFESLVSLISLYTQKPKVLLRTICLLLNSVSISKTTQRPFSGPHFSTTLSPFYFFIFLLNVYSKTMYLRDIIGISQRIINGKA